MWRGVVVGVLVLGTACKKPHQFATQQALVDTYVKAVNTDDLSLLKETVLPLSLKGINSENRVYFDRWLNRDLGRTIPHTRKIEFTALGDSRLKEKGFIYPMLPTHQFQLDYVGDGGDHSILRDIVYDGSSWYVVIPLPSQEILKQLQ